MRRAAEWRGGEAINLRAIGWSAFNTARIEAGTPLFGIDLTDAYLPMETGLWYSRAVAVRKGCYLGQEMVAPMHAHHSAARLFVGLRVEGEKLPIAGTDIFDGANQVGIVTSSCMSPLLKYTPIAMGYVPRNLRPPAGPWRPWRKASEQAWTWRRCHFGPTIPKRRRPLGQL